MQVLEFLPESTTIPHLDRGFERALRSLLSKLRRWKGFDPRRHHDVAEDLRQDLLLDCLENEHELARLTRSERNEYWLRLLQRQLYWLRDRPHQRARGPVEVDECCHLGHAEPESSEPFAISELMTAADRVRFLPLLHNAASLRNGRLNARATAERLGTTARAVCDQRNQLQEVLGRDREFIAFWTRRLVEALLGLAADLLRDERLVRIHRDSTRSRPDPTARLHRIATIRLRLSGLKLPPALRKVLRRWSRRGATADLSPMRLIADAVALRPSDPAVLLWRFEAAVAMDQLALAARSLRLARDCCADPVRTLLARARLLEVRGLESRAARLLARGLARHPREPRIVASLLELSACRALPHPA